MVLSSYTMSPATITDHEDEHVDDVELAPMSGPSHPASFSDDESIGSAESTFSNDEGEDNQYKPGAVGRAGLRVMDQELEEQRRRKNTFCLALLMLALGVAVLKFINSGDGPSSPTKNMPQPTSDTDADADDNGNPDLFGPGRKIKFTVANLEGKGADHVGEFTIQTHPDWAPIGAERFEALVSDSFYVGSRIFRVLDNFVAQWGICEDPAQQAEWDAKPLEDDLVLVSNKRGTISFATAGPGTRTSQVFVNTVNNKRLDKMGFSPFAEVVDGLDIVDKFYAGYGEGAPEGKGPSQSKMEKFGSKYVDKEFPLLSYFTGVDFVD
jgi:peptidyl-prolyl cis-trans isomerase A (cyclophilin A)